MPQFDINIFFTDLFWFFFFYFIFYFFFMLFNKKNFLFLFYILKNIKNFFIIVFKIYSKDFNLIFFYLSLIFYCFLFSKISYEKYLMKNIKFKKNLSFNYNSFFFN